MGNEEHCVLLQNWLFRNNLDEEAFEFVDANNDGLIDGDEAAAAMEMAEEDYTEGSDGDYTEGSEEDYKGDYDLTEDDVRDIINLVFCACDQGDHDGDLTLDEWMGPVCENVNDHLFGYQVSEDDFNDADANGDGVCTVDEVHDFAMSHADMRSLNREFYFSNDASVEAQVRLIGCACDNDGDYMLSLEEVNDDKCVLVQNWLFGNNLDEEAFEFVDANNDGFIDGDEAAGAMEMAEESMREDSEEEEGSEESGSDESEEGSEEDSEEGSEESGSEESEEGSEEDSEEGSEESGEGSEEDYEEGSEENSEE